MDIWAGIGDRERRFLKIAMAAAVLFCLSLLVSDSRILVYEATVAGKVTWGTPLEHLECRYFTGRGFDDVSFIKGEREPGNSDVRPHCPLLSRP